MLTLLVCNRARSLACGLAGSLALAATTLGCRRFQIFVIDSLDVLHKLHPPKPFMTIHRLKTNETLPFFALLASVYGKYAADHAATEHDQRFDK